MALNSQENSVILADDRKNLLYLLLSLPFCAFELMAFFSLPLYLIGHLISSCVLLGLLFWANQRRFDLRLPWLFFISVVFLGPLGVLGFFCFYVFYSIFKLFATPFEQWYAALFPTMQIPSASKIYERIIAGWDDYKTQREVISFQDMMRVGSLDQKQGVLDVIAQNFNPALAPILRSALEDRENLVRVHAASIIAKIDRDFELRKKELEAQLAKEPEESSYFLALAEHLDTYAFSGVIDFFREKESRELAIEYYKRYIDRKPDDHEAWVALGRILNRLQAFDQVASWFEEKLKRHEEIPANCYPWYWEALFMLQSYNLLSDSAKKAYNELAQQSGSKNLLDCVNLWINREK